MISHPHSWSEVLELFFCVLPNKPCWSFQHGYILNINKYLTASGNLETPLTWVRRNRGCEKTRRGTGSRTKGPQSTEEQGQRKDDAPNTWKDKMHGNGQWCEDKTTPKLRGPAMAFPGPQWYHTNTHFLKGMAALEDWSFRETDQITQKNGNKCNLHL